MAAHTQLVCRCARAVFIDIHDKFLNNSTLGGDWEQVRHLLGAGEAGICSRVSSFLEEVNQIPEHHLLRDSGGASNKTEIDAGTQPGWRAGSGNSIFDSTLAAVGPTVSPPATISGNVDPVPPPALPTLSIGDVTGTEGNSGTTPFVFTVSLSAPTSATVTVSFATANGTATAGVDYVSTSSQLTFSPNETSKTISVLVIGNTTFESDKTFTVNLSGPTNATIADGQGIGRIVNDDLAPTAATLSIGDISAPEGNSGTTAFVFTVTLAPASTSTVTVDYATASGTAAEGVDFVPAFGDADPSTRRTRRLDHGAGQRQHHRRGESDLQRATQ